MDRDIGRGRHGREARKAYTSARLKGPTPAPKRGRGRQGHHLVQGTHDAETGASGGSRTRSRARRVEEPVAQPEFDADEYINDDADYVEDQDLAQQQPPSPPPQQAPSQNEVQVYGEGPHDLSLLTEYHKHREILIWEANPNNHAVIDIQKPEEDKAWFWGLVEATGLASLVKTNFSVLDYGLIWAFANRWHAETSIFHLPIGEIDITLDDVQCLLHIPIEGKFLNHRKMTRDEGAGMVSSFLGVTLSLVLKLFGELDGPYLKHSFVESIFIDNWGYVDKAVADRRPMHEIRLFRERAIHAFLLYLGATALVHLENYLDHASLAKTTQMAGYMSFLQGWIIVHFPRLSVLGTESLYEDHMGWNAYFVPGQGHKECDGYRLSLDNIQMSDCVFSPYDGRRHVRPSINACWFSGWIRDGKFRAKHLPERVLRQFKFVQSIPRHPSTAATLGMNLFEIGRVWMEELELRLIDEEMRGPAVVNPWDHEPGYMRWFYRVSHSIMRPVEGVEEPQRPSNLEVVIEEQEARHDPNALEVCRNVSNELQRALDACEAQKSSPIWHTLRRVLGMLHPCLTYRRLRRGRRYR
ncbi:protein MAIN-LIKE [Trifolium repens]|nr:protein MAIN-LIKE [Trifolium repens]